MRRIDSLAYANRIARLHPVYKAGCSISALLACLVVSRIDVSLAVLALMLALSIGWAELPARFVLRLVVGEATFLAIGVLGVAVSVSLEPRPGGIVAGPLWIGTSPEALGLSATLLARALGCAAAMNFLALTTPMVAVVDLLRSMRVSGILIDLMTLMYRFIFVLLDAFDRMVLANEARLGFRDRRTTLATSGRIGAGLFVEAYRRSRCLEDALAARGWDGTIRVLPGAYEHPRWTRPLVARLAR
jgi:cobalt/nickel transport system permease protein